MVLERGGPTPPVGFLAEKKSYTRPFRVNRNAIGKRGSNREMAGQLTRQRGTALNKKPQKWLTVKREKGTRRETGKRGDLPSGPRWPDEDAKRGRTRRGQLAIPGFGTLWWACQSLWVPCYGRTKAEDSRAQKWLKTVSELGEKDVALLRRRSKDGGYRTRMKNAK